MKTRKYKNPTNRALPIPGFGMVGGRQEFDVEEHQMSAEIRRLTRIGKLRLIEQTEMVELLEEPKAPVFVEKEFAKKEDVSNKEKSVEKDDDSLTNVGKTMESKKEDDSNVSNDEPDEKKESKKRRRNKKSWNA